MHPLVTAQNTRLLLLGNEAIVRGALEAGVGFMSTYPGTPSSEIGDTFAKLHGDAGVVFEYSVNEKVALEVAGAAAAAGVRTLVAMKHVGVNVAADPLMTLSYIGVRGGLVLVTADDPGCHSSQNEQDNRHYARLGKLPMLEPATPEEAYRLVQEAFVLSERHQTPVLLRTTTRVSHTRAAVAIGELPPEKTRLGFVPDKRRFTPVPAVAKLRHPVVEENLRKIEAEFETSPLNRQWGEGRLGILTGGVSACYVEDVIKRLGVETQVRVFALATSYPVPRRRLADWVKEIERALVVEELDPILEDELRSACVRAGKLVPIFGKESGHFSLLGEVGPDVVTAALTQILGLDWDRETTADPTSLPGRPPILCPGCPHRATYYAVKLAVGDEALYLSDIGCYTLGFAPPIGMGDYFICMGSSASSSGGFAATQDKPVVSFLGDSTFYHSGLTGLINSVHQHRDLLLIIMDNGTTGMTGHQPHPGTSSQGELAVDLAALARAAGVERVEVIDPTHFKESLETIRALRRQPGTNVLISRSACPLFAKKSSGKKKEAEKFAIDHDRCMVCGRKAQGLQCDLLPQRHYALARGLARVAAGPDAPELYPESAPAKMEHPPCEAACPLGLCVQGYVEQIAAGRYAEARALIRQRLILPHVVCRVCNHPCEAVCVRGDIDEPIAVNALKRFAMERETPADRAAYVAKLKETIRGKGKKVAVVGAGPAGLSCAFDLRWRGYEVEIFEAESEAGGLCRWGIPEYRLPREELNKDLVMLADLGVRFRYGARFGVDFNLDGLKRDGYAAVFLALGQPRGAALGIPGEDSPGVRDALQFLREVNGGGKPQLAGEVVVVGGGNSAIDAARTALRLRASRVTVLYRRTRAEMPAIGAEIAAAIAEGVGLIELGAPEKITRDGARLTVTCRRMRLSAPDKSGRPRPEPTDQTFVLTADTLISAIGQMADESLTGLGEKLVDRWGRIQADPQTGATADPFVFGGGDAVTGPASVVAALQWGKYAAYGIDRALAEQPEKVVREAWRDRESMLAESRYRPVGLTPEPRRHAPSLPVAEAVGGFAEVEGSLSEADAKREADRCLACGLCAACHNCLDNFGCPAFYQDNGRIQINPILCDGCGACVQVCPNGAIVPVSLLTKEASS
ncbi:MAG: indolepyruvate ferredoxin oxidoreductase subunit alpha [Myxococcales bacterium]|nr:indolepyruvate ferredoxin oxidoreductase subunit alpha [Myxococcales bacterium]